VVQIFSLGCSTCIIGYIGYGGMVMVTCYVSSRIEDSGTAWTPWTDWFWFSFWPHVL